MGRKGVPMRKDACCGAIFIWLVLSALILAGEVSAIRVSPAQIKTQTPEASEQLLVSALEANGLSHDATREAKYAVVPADVAQVSSAGKLVPLKDGTAEVVVTVGNQTAKVPLLVQGIATPPPVSFQRDVIPILSKSGCNAGGCHGKAEGQNGFKLSVFGYDPVADYHALVSEGRGRRIFPASPDNSLLLLKGTALMPHGGGQKIDPGSRWHQVMRRWVFEGANLDEQVLHPTVRIQVEPTEVTLLPRGVQQLRVTAIDDEGNARCVTTEAGFQSNSDSIAGVDGDGQILATEVPGEAAILVRYMGHVAVCRVTRPHDSPTFARPPERNFIDRLVWDKLTKLHVSPSPAADDATYIRRVYLDTIGTLPTAAEAKQFLQDNSPDKRKQLVERLLERAEYSDYWAQRWSDILQVDKDTITPQGAVAMSRWVRKQVSQNVPYDRFVQSVLTAQGSTLNESPAAFFQVQADPEKTARAVSQLFLGVRIECAQCHHHPFERWDQPDYYALAGFFSGIERRALPQGAVKIVSKGGDDLKHPRSGKVIPAAGLGAPPATFTPGSDRRRALAEWATNPQNPYFTKAIANRIWAHYMGRGLVEPVDDLRATNPASNEPLLDALAEHMIAVKYDMKAFTRTILDSQAYQLSSQTLPTNRMDEQNYSHAAWKPIPAEVLLDAISQATAVPEDFNGWPKGYRAIQIWDNKLPSHFLETFGRPTRQTVCSCERGTEPSIAQALHLMNSPVTMQKVQDREGMAARLAQSELPPEKIVDELYLTTLSRMPSDAERQVMVGPFAEVKDRREATEDVLWTLLNLKEFVFNH